MPVNRRANILVWFLALLFLVVIGGVYALNQWLQQQMGMLETPVRQQAQSPQAPIPPSARPVREEPPTVATQRPPELAISDIPPGAEIVRKTRVMQGGEYTESLYYYENKEIARVKEGARGKVLSRSGEIPDGPVKFMDVYKKTRGIEYYRDGVRHGDATTFYEDGQIKSEAVYRYGELLAEKEYYPDGVVRFEVNYSDARDFGPDKDNREVGIGKLYYPDGTIKYEWHVVNKERTGYKKSYNQDGRVRAIFYINEQGNIIKESYPGKDGTTY